MSLEVDKKFPVSGEDGGVERLLDLGIGPAESVLAPTPVCVVPLFRQPSSIRFVVQPISAVTSSDASNGSTLLAAPHLGVVQGAAAALRSPASEPVGAAAATAAAAAAAGQQPAPAGTC